MKWIKLFEEYKVDKLTKVNDIFGYWLMCKIINREKAELTSKKTNDCLDYFTKSGQKVISIQQVNKIETFEIFINYRNKHVNEFLKECGSYPSFSHPYSPYPGKKNWNWYYSAIRSVFGLQRKVRIVYRLTESLTEEVKLFETFYKQEKIEIASEFICLWAINKYLKENGCYVTIQPYDPNTYEIRNEISLFARHYIDSNRTNISDEKDLCAKYVSKLLLVNENALWGLDWHLKPYGYKYAYERTLFKAAKEFINKNRWRVPFSRG